MKRKIQRLFDKACTEYQLLEDGDRILVAVSGGKDSLMLVRLMAARARIYRPKIEVEAVHVVMENIPYETDRTYLEHFCKEAGLPLRILRTRFDKSTDKRKTHCFLCAWHRRKAIFEYATENGFNKIALGHHNDDFLITMLLNMTFEGSCSSMQPKMQMEHYPIRIIRPLCLVHESMIQSVAEEDGFQKQKTPCPYEHETQRTKMKAVLKQLEEMNPEVRGSMWHAISKKP